VWLWHFQTGLVDPGNQNGHKQPKNYSIFKDLQFYHVPFEGLVPPPVLFVEGSYSKTTVNPTNSFTTVLVKTYFCWSTLDKCVNSCHVYMHLDCTLKASIFTLVRIPRTECPNESLTAHYCSFTTIHKPNPCSNAYSDPFKTCPV